MRDLNDSRRLVLGAIGVEAALKQLAPIFTESKREARRTRPL
jgi:hypothetical protein